MDLAEGWTDLGNDHLIRRTVNVAGEQYGFIEAHRDGAVQWCYGGLTRTGMDVGRPMWDVVQEEPLTLHPSIECTVCGSHGFIREGRWVPA